MTCTHCRLGETSVYQLAPEGSTEPESTRERQGPVSGSSLLRGHSCLEGRKRKHTRGS